MTSFTRFPQLLGKLLVVCTVAASASLTPAEDRFVPMPVEDALTAKSFVDDTPLAMSSDGMWVAYALFDPRRRLAPQDQDQYQFTPTGVPRRWAFGDVWVTKTASGESKNLTGANSNWAPAWSPNGRYLAFYSDRGGEAHLWVWERDTGALRQVSTAIVRSYFGFEGPQWTSDGKHVLVKLLPEGMTIGGANDLLGSKGSPNGVEQSKNPGVTATVYRAAGSVPGGISKDGAQSSTNDSWTNTEFADLALLDVETGTVDRIAKRVKARGYWISPDDRYVAYTNTLGFKNKGSTTPIYDLVLLGLRDRTSRQVSKITGSFGMTVSWSPNGRLLSYTTTESPGKSTESPVAGECFVVSPEKGEPRVCTGMAHPDLSDRTPLWDRTGNSLYFAADKAVWEIDLSHGTVRKVSQDFGRVRMGLVSSPAAVAVSPGGRSLLLRGRNSETYGAGFYRLDLSSGVATKLIEENKSYGGPELTTGTTDGNTIIYSAEDAEHDLDLWITDAAFNQPRRLTSINPQFERYVMGRSRVIEYRGDDGNILHGALLLPAGFKEGQRYPLLVVVYGGGFYAGNVHSFGLYGKGIENMQLFATRGYVILYPDMPMSDATPMRDVAKTVLPAVNKAIELGIVDPERLGVMGHSYGGYTTLSLIVQTKRFRAAAARGSIPNLLAMYGHMNSGSFAQGVGWNEDGQGRMGGTPWQVRERYIENSPVFFLDSVATPLLLIHGDLDETAPPSLPEEVFVGLRRLGKEVVYAKYAGEGHWEEQWSYPNRNDYIQRLVAWFDDHLKPRLK